MRLDTKEMKEKFKEISSDVERGEFTAKSWLWFLTGGLIGILASCVKFKDKETKPIIASLNRVKNKMEE